MITGISPNSIYDPGMLNRLQKVQQEFQQLGKDLQSGNLGAAQTDFAALEQMDPQAAPTASTGNDPITKDFGQLSQDLQSGNLSAAQQDFAALQQDFQKLTGAASANSNNPLGQAFDQILQMLGNQHGAQQAYLLQFAQNGGSMSTSADTIGKDLSAVA